jgi:uncharacterized protein (DUF1015 family)
MNIKPFNAVRVRPDLAAKVAAVPYDVVDTNEAKVLAEGNPFSFLHVSRAEIDMSPAVDPYSDQVYLQGRDTLQRFLNEGTLVREPTARLYLYRQTMGAHVQRGIVTCCATADYESHVIKTHEKTRQDKEDDRTRHIKTHNAQSGPIFLVYRDNPAINRLVAQTEQTTPLFDFVAPDGIHHAGWIFPDAADLVRAFTSIPAAYIADGHHRAAAATRVARERRAANLNHTGNEEYNWFLGVLFPASQVQVLPYNRLVKDLFGLSPSSFMNEISKRFTVTPTNASRPPAPGSTCMYLAGAWYLLSWTLPPGASPEERLDVTVLQNRLLAPVLGITDPRTSKRIEFVGGIRGTEELVRRVDNNSAAVAFSMHPTTVNQMLDIADAGGIMPPKSTWFEPKLRDGLFIHTLD